jgi:molybdopterin molybdotransferase
LHFGDPLEVETTGPQGSGILTSLSRANVLIHLPPEQSNVTAGDWVDVSLLEDQ